MTALRFAVFWQSGKTGRGRGLNNLPSRAKVKYVDEQSKLFCNNYRTPGQNSAARGVSSLRRCQHVSNVIEPQMTLGITSVDCNGICL